MLTDKREEESSVEGVMRGLRPDGAAKDEELPQYPAGPAYPGKQLDPRGASSVLSQRINQSMAHL